jgi:tRNA pseudouridine55 synthase
VDGIGSGTMNRRTKYREIDGVLLLDKSTGLSSNRALQQARALLRAHKAGHCGSLDPLASGLLPICFGQATKFSSYLLDADKTYRAVCRLGQVSATGDAEGEIIETRPVAVEAAQLPPVLERFTGRIEQIPPMYSALKHEGRRLYQLAREGRQVERKARQVEIFSLVLKSFDSPLLEIEVRCSKGTYIRTLAEDIGRALGCGAHIAALRRCSVGELRVGDGYSIARLEEIARDGDDCLQELLLPISTTLMRFPEILLDADASLDIRHGRRVKLASPRDAGLYRLSSPEGIFLGLGEVGLDADLMPKRLMNTAR